MKNRTAQLIFQSIYAALALVACVGSVGFYDMKFTSDFYIYFMISPSGFNIMVMQHIKKVR